MQHFLNFLPAPHGQGSFRPTDSWEKLPASAFALTPGHAPNIVRIAISAPLMQNLERGHLTIRTLLVSSPSDAAME